MLILLLVSPTILWIKALNNLTEATKAPFLATFLSNCLWRLDEPDSYPQDACSFDIYSSAIHSLFTKLA